MKFFRKWCTSQISIFLHISNAQLLLFNSQIHRNILVVNNSKKINPKYNSAILTKTYLSTGSSRSPFSSVFIKSMRGRRCWIHVLSHFEFWGEGGELGRCFSQVDFTRNEGFFMLKRIFDLTVELSFGLLVKSQTVVVAWLSRAWPTSYQQLTLLGI